MYTIRRKGTFSTRLIVGTSHCGILISKTRPKRTFEYDAWVTVEDRGLDDRGFVIDNIIFTMFFEAQTEMAISCEMLAKRACDAFYEALLPRQKPHMVEICTRIWGLPQEAYAEFKLLGAKQDARNNRRTSN